MSVSVSSNGSLALRPPYNPDLIAPFIRFSILERIVGIETAPVAGYDPVHLDVSVSSNGSLALRLLTGLDEYAAVTEFQYPRTDRWH